MRTESKVWILMGVVLVAAAVFFVKNTGKSRSELTESRLLTSTPTTPPRMVEPEPRQEPEPVAKLVPAHKVAPEPEQVLTAETDVAVAPTLDAEPAPKAKPEDTSPRYYTVEKGDTLYSISRNSYGNGKFWKAIYQANKKLITNPAALQPVWKLKLPRPEELAQ